MDKKVLTDIIVTRQDLRRKFILLSLPWRTEYYV